MKLNLTPRVGTRDPDLQRELREHARQVNDLSEGKISAAYAAQATLPTTGEYAQGDFVRNSAPVEMGLAGNKYIVFGWTCVVGGAPGTFVQFRAPTGN